MLCYFFSNKSNILLKVNWAVLVSVFNILLYQTFTIGYSLNLLICIHLLIILPSYLYSLSPWVSTWSIIWKKKLVSILAASLKLQTIRSNILFHFEHRLMITKNVHMSNDILQAKQNRVLHCASCCNRQIQPRFRKL